MDDTDPLAGTIAYVALQRLQSRYADAVTRRAWSELASLVRADCPIVVDEPRIEADYDVFDLPIIDLEDILGGP